MTGRLREHLAQAADGGEGLRLLEARPLYAHDEMVGAEAFAPAGDLLLHRDLVADDEAIARDLRETHVRGGAFHAPGGVGVVFVFQWAAAFVHRGRVLGADVALARDGEFGDGLAELAQRVAVDLHQRLGGAESGGVGDQPGVADARGALHRGLHQAGDPDRRAAGPVRLQADAVVVDRIEAALEGDAVLGPQLAHQGDGFGEAWGAFLQRDVEGAELALAVAEPDAEHEIAAA